MKKIYLAILFLTSFLPAIAQEEQDEDIVMVNNNEETNVTAKEFSENRLLFLNAANFDFTGSLKINYVGHINIFAPNLTEEGSWIGINTGIMKLNYLTGDTSKYQFVSENISLNPLYAQPDSGQRYTRQFSRYKYKISNTAWSFYVQPLIKLYCSQTGGDMGSSLYWHFHAELLAEHWRITTSKENIAQDTLTYLPGDNAYINRYSENEINTSISRLNGFFGTGITTSIAPWEKSLVFFQATIGITNFDNFVGLNNNMVPPRRLMTNGNWCGFYLVRAYYTQKMSDAATIVLGTDIRGYLPAHAPNYATYLGLNLDVQKLVELIGGS